MFSTKPSLGLKGHGLKKKKNQVGGFFTTVLLLLKGLFQKIMWSKSQREHLHSKKSGNETRNTVYVLCEDY